MTQDEIKEKIRQNNKLIKENFNTNFVLNKKILDLMNENTELQKLCKHEYTNGICKYCNKEEECE